MLATDETNVSVGETARRTSAFVRQVHHDLINADYDRASSIDGASRCGSRFDSAAPRRIARLARLSFPVNPRFATPRHAGGALRIVSYF
ncbi:hypothetical protein [Burkholderia anthina]|uniref:hypothetical protein n=1 Tax=Burkholderia anthina TaxID=179879 RepID=UPI0037BF006C